MDYSRIIPLRLDIQRISDISPEPPLPIDAETLRAHCHCTESDDVLLDTYQRAALEWAEGQQRRTLIPREHRWILKNFPTSGDLSIRLPRGKTVSVESIEYSQNGVVTTLSGPTSSTPSADYQEDLSGDDGGVVMPLRGESWPSVDCDVPAPVIITFTAGFDEVPDDYKHALMFATSTMFEYRGAPDVVTEMLTICESLLPAPLTRFY